MMTFHRTIFCLVLAFFVPWVAGCAEDHVAKQKRVQALQDLGNALAAEGKSREGLSRLMEALEMEPNNAEIHHQIAILFRNEEQYERSLQYFQRALTLQPRFPEAQNNLGTLYLMMGKWDDAIPCFEKALEDFQYKTPQFAYNNLGLAYFNKGNREKAIENFQLALRASRPYSVAHANLARTYEVKGDLLRAEGAYTDAAYYAPWDPGLQLSLARILLRNGKLDQAEAALKRTMELGRRTPEALEAQNLLETLLANQQGGAKN